MDGHTRSNILGEAATPAYGKRRAWQPKDFVRRYDPQDHRVDRLRLLHVEYYITRQGKYLTLTRKKRFLAAVIDLTYPAQIKVIQAGE
jgi:hypothetical protein